jgi:hypothetical protein
VINPLLGGTEIILLFELFERQIIEGPHALLGTESRDQRASQ